MAIAPLTYGVCIATFWQMKKRIQDYLAYVAACFRRTRPTAWASAKGLWGKVITVIVVSQLGWFTQRLGIGVVASIVSLIVSIIGAFLLMWLFLSFMSGGYRLYKENKARIAELEVEVSGPLDESFDMTGPQVAVLIMDGLKIELKEATEFVTQGIISGQLELKARRHDESIFYPIQPSMLKSDELKPDELKPGYYRDLYRIILSGEPNDELLCQQEWGGYDKDGWLELMWKPRLEVGVWYKSLRFKSGQVKRIVAEQNKLHSIGENTEQT